jgi:hypothetical protein
MHGKTNPIFFLALFCLGGLTGTDLPAQQSQVEQLAELDRRVAEVNERNRLTQIINLGIDAYQQDNSAAALAHFQDAMNQGFGEPVIHFYLGMAHAGLGQAYPALTELDRYLRLEPNGEFEDQALELVDKIADLIP